MKRLLPRAIAAAFCVLALAPGAHAQQSGWDPWLGCWDMVRENVREGMAIPGVTGPATTLPSSTQRTAPRVCVTRTGTDAVSLTTTVEGQPVLEQAIVSDGSEQPIADERCRGSQRAEWSADGQRLLSRAELSCGGQESRSVSALSLIAPDGTWLDIRTIRLGTAETTRVSRYRRAGGQPAAQARAGARLTLAAVVEAAAKLSPRTIEAALVETRASFDLTSRELLELDEARVPANVIDLMVALSYPERFVVERTARRDSPSAFAGDPFIGSPFGSPFGFGSFYDDFSDPYFPAYYYSPFAYSYLGRYDPRYFGPGFAVGAIDGGGPAGSDSPRASGSGRVINGVGYTQVKPREAEPQTSAGERGAITPLGASSGSGSGSSSGGGTGSVSSGGFSSGGSGGDGGGRTAQPR